MRAILSSYLHGSGTLEQVRTAEDFAELCRAVRDDGAGRLRWRVLRQLGIAPWQGMPGRDEYLYALANLQADRDEVLNTLCPDCRAYAAGGRCSACGAPIPVENPAFDESRFEELKHDRSSI